MSSIIALPQSVVNKIAAGEVVNYPVNAVKEMVENSLDAGAHEISVFIQRGGIDIIEVEDDGKGISRVDMELVCQRHATSKLREFDDLKDMSTYGFRGEAMASISNVADVTVKSRTAEDRVAHMVAYKNGKMVGELAQASSKFLTGTTIIVKDLFHDHSYHQRLKALRPSIEAIRVMEMLCKYAVHHPNVKFKLSKKDGKNKLSNCFQTDGSGNQHDVIVKLLNKKGPLCDLSGGDEDLHYRFTACFTSPIPLLTANSLQSKKEKQKVLHLFINGRLVRCDLLKRTIDAVFKDQRKICVYMTFSLEIEHNLIDVNVSPTKEEVKFQLESLICQSISQKFNDYLNESNKSQNVGTPVPRRECPSLDKSNTGSQRGEAVSKVSRSAETLETNQSFEKRTRSALSQNRNTAHKNITEPSNSFIGSKSQLRRNSRAPHRLLVDHKERKIEEFYGLKPISPYVELVPGARLVPINSNLLRHANELNNPTSLDSPMVAPNDLDSVQNLKRLICSEADKNLMRKFKEFYFVGFYSTRRAFFQSGTECYRFYIAPILQEFFFEQIIFDFGALGSYKLESKQGGGPLPMRKLLRLHFLKERATLPDVNKIIDMCLEVLVSQADLLWEFFSIRIVVTNDGPALSSIPCIFSKPQPYIPPMDKIPQLLYHLSVMVDYDDEERCFEGVARCVADFFVPLKTAEGGGSINKIIKEEDAIEAAELCDTDAEKKRRIRTVMNNMRHVIFPRFKQKFIPSKSIAKFVQRVVSTREACKMFGRCGSGN